MDEFIKVGEKEYSPEELNELVGYGSKYKEFSDKYDTDPEKAWKSYGKVTTEYAELKKEAETLREAKRELEQIKAQKKPDASGEYTPDQLREAKDALKKIGAVTKEDMGDLLKEYGFLKSEDVDHKFATRDLAKKFDDMTDKFDGKDGRPKFDQEDMISYMERNGLRDPELAYKTKFNEELSEWRAQKILEEKYPQIVTGGKSSKKEPPKVVVTKDNMKDLLKERLKTI